MHYYLICMHVYIYIYIYIYTHIPKYIIYTYLQAVLHAVQREEVGARGALLRRGRRYVYMCVCVCIYIYIYIYIYVLFIHVYMYVCVHIYIYIYIYIYLFIYKSSSAELTLRNQYCNEPRRSVETFVCRTNSSEPHFLSSESSCCAVLSVQDSTLE